MPMLSVLTVALAAASAASATQQVARGHDVASATLARHEAFVGGAAALRSCPGIVLEGEIEIGAETARYRAFVRVDPPALREEIQPPGEDDARVYVSDLRHAWEVTDAGAVPLRGPLARAVLENAFVLSFGYLDLDGHDSDLDRGVSGTRTRAFAGPPTTLPRLAPVPGAPPIVVQPVGFRTPAGTFVIAGFDLNDGRMRLRVDPTVRTWLYFGEWQETDGLVLPKEWRAGAGARHLTTTRIHEVRTGVVHDGALFAGAPAPPLCEGRVGKLLRVPGVVPGATQFVVEDAELDGRPVAALVDTGADAIYVDDRAAAAMRLHPLAQRGVRALHGRSRATLCWLDRLRVGAFEEFQLVLHAIRLPPVVELPAGRSPPLVFGGPALLSCSPLFDLAGRELVLRGPGAVDSPADEQRVAVPLRRRPGAELFEVDVRIGDATLPAVVDTGFAAILRLSPAALRAAGLPDRKDAWIERGALPVEIGGAGGQSAVELVAQIDELRLGRVRFLKPFVYLAGLAGRDGPGGPEGAGGADGPEGPEGADEAERAIPHDAILGGGALACFARFGIDTARARLDLDIGIQCARDPDEEGGFVVRENGRFLGLVVGPPDAGAFAEPGSLPRVLSVAEGSAAHRAGLRAGDRLLAIDGMPLATQPPAAFVQSLWCRGGQRVGIAYQRGDGIRTVVLP